MYLHRRQNLIGGAAGGRGGLPRRRLLEGAGALTLAATLRPTAVFAKCDDEGERLGPFGPWSRPINLGPVVNSRFHERRCAISKDGLSLYITSDRPGGVNGPQTPHRNEIWVSQRASIDAPWQAPVNLDAFNTTPVINAVGSGTANPNLSADGHLLFFQSGRPGEPRPLLSSCRRHRRQIRRGSAPPGQCLSHARDPSLSNPKNA